MHIFTILCQIYYVSIVSTPDTVSADFPRDSTDSPRSRLNSESPVVRKPAGRAQKV